MGRAMECPAAWRGMGGREHQTLRRGEGYVKSGDRLPTHISVFHSHMKAVQSLLEV